MTVSKQNQYTYLIKNTEKNLRLLGSNKKSDYQTLKNRLVKLGKLPNIKFGQAVVFWSCLLHSVPENIENETRWTFNLRLKNAFTPYGKKVFWITLRFYEKVNLQHLV